MSIAANNCQQMSNLARDFDCVFRQSIVRYRQYERRKNNTQKKLFRLLQTVTYIRRKHTRSPCRNAGASCVPKIIV